MADILYEITGGFFDSVNQDRTYSAEQMNMPYKKIVTDGIFPDKNGGASEDFIVRPDEGMYVSVGIGNALVGGKWAELDSLTVLRVPSNTSAYSRIDSIILRADTSLNVRAVCIVYRQGTEAASPTAPALESSEYVTELRLADITVAAGASTITSANITDQRGTEECPWVAGAIPPTQAQVSEAVDQYFEENPGIFVVDSTFSDSSTNAVQNKVVKAAVDQLTDDVTELNGRLDQLSEVIVDRTLTDSTEVVIPVTIPIKYVGDLKYRIENKGSAGYFQIYMKNANNGQVFALSQRIEANSTLEGTVTTRGSEDITSITIKSVNGRVVRFYIYMTRLDAFINSAVAIRRSVTLGTGLESIEENYGYGNAITINASDTATRIFRIEPRYSGVEMLDIFADSTVTEIPHNKYVYADLATGKLYLSDDLITSDTSKVLLFQNYLGLMQKGFSADLRTKLITGLSAEVSELSAEIDASRVAGYTYHGERIQIAPQLKYKNIATFTRGYRQGAACYGNLIFQFHSQNQVEDGNFHGCTIYDINAGAEIQFIDLGYNELLHNNNATFGTQKYNDADPFPLLYASQENANARYILAYRITETGNASAPYAMTVVQTITVPPMSEWPVVYPNACVGNDGYLYIIGWRSVETKYEIIKYSMPTGNVTLAYADRIKSVEWPVLTNGQGFIVFDNKLYYSCGNNSNSNMQVIDLFDGNIISTIHFNDCDLPYEPEGVFLHNGKLCVSFVTYGVAEFTF